MFKLPFLCVPYRLGRGILRQIIRLLNYYMTQVIVVTRGVHLRRLFFLLAKITAEATLTEADPVGFIIGAIHATSLHQLGTLRLVASHLC